MQNKLSKFVMQMGFKDNDIDERHQDPNNWKWGLFYYNPKDERLFLPKRNPAMGATMNFARPAAYLLFFPPIILAILLAVFL